MNTYLKSREQITRPFQPARKSSFVLARAVALAIATSGVAYAQQAEPAKAPMTAAETAEKEAAEKAKALRPGTIETVVVTGIRRGIEASISVKKNSDNIVESISAEDIGKLPDNSIAESIARLPGVAAQRVAGRGGRLVGFQLLNPDARQSSFINDFGIPQLAERIRLSQAALDFFTIRTPKQSPSFAIVRARSRTSTWLMTPSPTFNQFIRNSSKL